MAKDPNTLQKNIGAVREALFRLYEMGQRAARLSDRDVKLTHANIASAKNTVITEAVKKIDNPADQSLVAASLNRAGEEMLQAGWNGRDLSRKFSSARKDIAKATWVDKVGLSEKDLNLRHAPDIFTRMGQAVKDTPDSLKSLTDGVRLSTGGEKFKAGAMLAGSAALAADAVRRATTKAPEGQSRGKRITFAAVELVTAAALSVAAVTKITADVRMFGPDNLKAASAGQSR